MSSMRALLLTGVTLASGGGLMPLDQQVVAQQAHDSPPVGVTTDTAEYCLYLQDRIHTLILAAVAPPSHEATALTQEGQRICEHGQTRGGIMRLRRALLLIRHEDPSAQR
jgi:hypothetical protein